jgi:hypothetical protein
MSWSRLQIRIAQLVQQVIHAGQAAGDAKLGSQNPLQVFAPQRRHLILGKWSRSHSFVQLPHPLRWNRERGPRCSPLIIQPRQTQLVVPIHPPLTDNPTDIANAGAVNPSIARMTIRNRFDRPASFSCRSIRFSSSNDTCASTCITTSTLCSPQHDGQTAKAQEKARYFKLECV